MRGMGRGLKTRLLTRAVRNGAALTAAQRVSKPAQLARPPALGVRPPAQRVRLPAFGAGVAGTRKASSASLCASVPV